ncbi:hypothetical protein TEA_027995 [Camellia sinensis var. sinensis]|uniref:Uncharacterized protein n=1 Tax=Camellia sinensis var. sinensis TaxID=542762 RepID=A0A4S4F2V8_CAMSN|nr:hypothetical protein TEA_027995 [Camellia sinensis var. sinensis]
MLKVLPSAQGILKDSDAVKEALDQLSEVGWANKWSSQPYVSRRMTSLRELTTLGIKNAENLAIPSVRNDAAFLFTVVGTTGFLGVLAGQLPGDWGFFVPYLIGSISLVVLAVGSISPGLLQAAIGGFSSLFPDYQDRIARHEAAHFLDACAALDLGFSPKSSCCCRIWTKPKAMTIGDFSLSLFYSPLCSSERQWLWRGLGFSGFFYRWMRGLSGWSKLWWRTEQWRLWWKVAVQGCCGRDLGMGRGRLV